MNLRSSFAWVRVAGLASVLGLVACDSGDSKKAEPVKADVVAKAEEPAKTEPAKVEPAPEPAKVDPPADVKAADTAAAVAAKSVGDTAAADTAAAADAAAPVDDKPAEDTKPADDKPADAKPAEDKKPAAPKKPAAEKEPALDGKPLYLSKCKVCHAEGGEGTAAMKKNNIPDMSDKGWQGKHSKAAVAKAITNGVPGTKMQSFKAKLKPEEIDAVAAYVKKLK